MGYLIAPTSGIKPGTIAHFAQSTPPAGWLKANGAAVSRSAYAALFNAIGTTYGDGTGGNLLINGSALETWTPANATVQANQVTAPNGTSEADKITATANSVAGVKRAATLNAGIHTLAAYFKRGGQYVGASLQINEQATPSNYARMQYNPDTLSANSAASNVLSVISGAITDAGGGWFFCRLTFELFSPATVEANLRISSNGSSATAGEGDIAYYWGATLVEGAVALDIQNASSFNLPDLRAEFIRGLDDSRGIDAGRLIGSSQADEFKSHQHQQARGSNGGAPYRATAWHTLQSDTGTSTDEKTLAAGGTETRPRNVALLACIKY